MSAVPTRILLAVHGGEPAGWGAETRQALAMWSRPWIRILAVLAVPSPPFTSLIPPAARRYRAARAAWQDAEEKRVQRVIDELMPALPGEPDIAWTLVSYGDPGRAIAEHARVLGGRRAADGGDTVAGLWLGAVHDRVIRHARCPVLLTPAPGAGREA